MLLHHQAYRHGPFTNSNYKKYPGVFKSSDFNQPNVNKFYGDAHFTKEEYMDEEFRSPVLILEDVLAFNRNSIAEIDK
ncbi:hypothetical protein DASC09_038520 [Saccharomycopsis crataegensis]|uniref:Uncharacterized protein n=1 Tax=Saccharomycopsis crataegensis TaxID=43959 RepID=A0AAV5QPL4_9ASCO|nr:hypothetical protein DASC09_038520 [Saccharomycopsis crataegensis]